MQVWVLGMVERLGRSKFKVVDDRTESTLTQVIKENIS
jgi:hypothetical protein